jgi:putative RecB family exonuclease
MVMYSHTRLSTFDNCPYRFRLKYIDKLRPEIEQTIEAFMGSMVHAALGKLYKDARFEKINRLEEILEFYKQQWKKNWNPAILIVRKEYTADNYLKMGEKYISEYYKRYHPFTQARTIGLEQRVTVDLGGGNYKMQGYIDRLAYRDEGVYEIHDYKTSFSIPLQQYIEEDRQLALYALAVRSKYPNAQQIRLIWHFLSAGQEVVLEKTDEEMEKLKASVISDIDRIESATEYPTRPGRLCEWCEFRPMCPEWGHAAKTEGMTIKDFLKEPGVVLVNKFAELSEKKRRIEDELEELKDKILAFAREHAVSTLMGSGYNAKVWSAEKFRFPGKNDEGRAELEDFLEKSGLLKDVSALDTFMLSRKMDEKDWPDDIKKALEKFGRKELIEKIYLKKKDERN